MTIIYKRMMRGIINHPYNFILKTESWMWMRRRLYTQGWTSAYAEQGGIVLVTENRFLSVSILMW